MAVMDPAPARYSIRIHGHLGAMVPARAPGAIGWAWPGLASSPLTGTGAARAVGPGIIGPKEAGMTAQTLENIRELAQQLRVDSIRCSTAAGSGHPTSSVSAADLMAVLLAPHFRYDWHRPDAAANEHPIVSKGTASRLLY